MMLWQVWRKELKQFDSWLRKNGKKEKIGKSRYFGTMKTGWEGPQSAVLVTAGDVWVYVMVVNIADCLISTVNLMKKYSKGSNYRT